MHREGLGHIRPLGQRLARLDHHRIRPDLEPLRIEPGLAVADVEFPAMPGATQQFADPRTLVDPGLRRGQPRHARRLVERRAGVRTTVEQREEFAVDVEHDDVALPHDRILQAVWGPDYGSEVQYLRVFIKQLRKKLEPDPGRPRYILTEPWFGYRFRMSEAGPAMELLP